MHNKRLIEQRINDAANAAFAEERKLLESGTIKPITANEFIDALAEAYLNKLEVCPVANQK